MSKSSRFARLSCSSICLTCSRMSEVSQLSPLPLDEPVIGVRGPSPGSKSHYYHDLIGETLSQRHLLPTPPTDSHLALPEAHRSRRYSPSVQSYNTRKTLLNWIARLNNLWLNLLDLMRGLSAIYPRYRIYRNSTLLVSRAE